MPRNRIPRVMKYYSSICRKNHGRSLKRCLNTKDRNKWPNSVTDIWWWWSRLTLLTPNDHYSGRTAPLTSKRSILYIYSTNIGIEYFKHSIYSPFIFSFSKCSLFHNSNVFGSCIIHILYTGCAEIKKKIIPASKG